MGKKMDIESNQRSESDVAAESNFVVMKYMKAFVREISQQGERVILDPGRKGTL